MTKLQRNWAICTGCIVLMIAGLIGSYQSSTQAQNIAGTPITRQPNQAAARGTNDILLVTSVTEQGQQITVIDAKTKAICVYLIQRGSGKIKLLSARNAQWDFQIDEFNSESPTPREIQSLLDR